MRTFCVTCRYIPSRYVTSYVFAWIVQVIFKRNGALESQFFQGNNFVCLSFFWLHKM